MKIECRCGSVIFDQTDGLKSKAHFIPDQGYNAMWDAIDEQVLPALANGQISIGDASMKLRDIMRAAGQRMMWQCADCGRIYMDDRCQPTRLQCFVPQSVDADKRVLQQSGSRSENSLY